MCGTQNPRKAKKCRCGFCLSLSDVQYETGYTTNRSGKNKARKIKYEKEMMGGIFWMIFGLIITVAIFLVPDLSQVHKTAYVFLSFLIVAYGIFEIIRCHLKIRRIMTKPAKK